MMKRFSQIIRLSLSCCALSTLLILAPQAQAVTGDCRPDNGVTQFNFNFTSKFSSPEQNVVGKVFTWANQGKAWADSATRYSMTCECRNGSISQSYITAEKGSGLGTEVTTGSSTTGLPMTFFRVDDYLAVAAEVFIAGGVNGGLGNYFPVPFQNRSNENSSINSHPCNYLYGSGRQGKIHIYFIRPFVGSHTTPPVHITNIRISTESGVVSQYIAASVTMTATVEVDQSCVLSPDPITIDFGDIMSSQFKTAGAMPDGFTPVNKQLTLACRNISDGVKVNLSFTATPDPNMNNALKTDNSDIAIMIKDRNGNVISPSKGSLPVNMTGLGTLNSTGQAEINVYPVNTTGKLPAVGVFKNATGTVTVEIE